MAQGQQTMVHPELMLPTTTNNYVISERTVSSATSSSPSILCVVCGDQAAGKYFGALICEACKSFFIRSTKKGEPQFKCSNNGLCTITPTSRLLCQSCRYQKCIEVGMCRKVKQNSKEPANDQILCKVCNDVSSGIHFGVYTCEGCKGFYRRSLRDSSNYTCVDNKQCSITPSTRNVCRYCRFQKCLEVGMSRSGIKLGRHQKYDATQYSGGRRLPPNLDDGRQYVGNGRLLPTLDGNIAVMKHGKNIPVPRLESYSQEDADDLDIYLGDTFLIDLPGFGEYYGDHVVSEPLNVIQDNAVFDVMSDPIHMIPLQHQDMFNSNYPAKMCGMTHLPPAVDVLNTHNFHNPCLSAQAYHVDENMINHAHYCSNGSMENSPSVKRKTLNHCSIPNNTPPTSLHGSPRDSPIPFALHQEQYVNVPPSIRCYDPFDPGYLTQQNPLKENIVVKQIPMGYANVPHNAGLETGQLYQDVTPTNVASPHVTTQISTENDIPTSTNVTVEHTYKNKLKSQKSDVDSSPESCSSFDSTETVTDYEVELEKNCAYVGFVRSRLQASRTSDEVLSPGMEEMRKQRQTKFDSLLMDTDMFDISKAFEDLTVVCETLEKSPEHQKATKLLSQFVGRPGPTDYAWKMFQQRLSKLIASSIIFAKKIPGFTNIEVSDKMVLIKSGTFLMILIQLSWKDDCKFEWFVDTFLTMEALRVFTAGMEAETRKFREDLKNAKLDGIEIALMTALVVLNPDIPKLVNPIIVLDMHSRFREILKKYCFEKSQNLNGYSKILKFVPCLYNIEIIHKECVRSGHIQMPDIQLPALFAEINLS